MHPFLRLFSLFSLTFFTFTTHAAIVPPGFAEVIIAEELNPTDMRQADDGRIFIAQKDGRILLVDADGTLHPDPFYTLTVDNYNERGLSGIALHPDFANQPWVYLYYTVPGANHNRVIRVMAHDDHVVPGSEQIIFELDALNATIHNGGAMEFGTDGKLYVTVGDGGNAAGAQNLQTTAGKVLRLNDDGTIPTDNPFYNATNNQYRAIYALGFRNPFSMAIDALTGRIFLSEVGNAAWEEINEVLAGKNYGWPIIEGPLAGQTPPDNYEEPKHAYPHSMGCAAIGAAFSSSNFANYPPEFAGKFFYADYCNGYIKAIDLNTGQVTGTFITGINRPIKFFFSPNGDFYYLARAGLGGGSDADNTATSNGTLVHVFFVGNGEPFITRQPKAALASVGETPAFSVRVYGNTPMNFRWQLNGLDIPGADTATVVLPPVTLAENGALLRCIASNALGIDTSFEAVLSVTSNQRPMPFITFPDPNMLWHGGDTIYFEGYATDFEEGTLGNAHLTWRVNFHHDVHTHPVLGPESDISNGFWIIPNVYETDPDVWFRIYLTAVDSGGLSRTIFSDIYPLTRALRVVGPPGLQLNLDGSTLPVPLDLIAVAGIQRVLNAPRVFISGDSLYTFLRWSDDNIDLPRTFIMPETDLAMRLIYNAAPLGAGVGLLGRYYIDDDFDFSVAPSVTRIDPVVDFDWGAGGPDPLLPIDNYAVRWEGFVLPLFNEKLTFHTITDDGVRLWVNDNLLIDKWIPQGPTEWTGAIDLDAGKKARIRMEFYELGGGAVAQLRWSSARIPSSVIPKQQLFPPLEFQPAEARGQVWVDDNYNGLQDAGENPIADATVLLLDSASTLVIAQQTNQNGNYAFSIPPPGGQFSLRFILPAALSDYENTTGLNPGGISDPSTLQAGGLWSLAAGFASKRAAIDGLVWLDENNNGFPDINEAGLEGIPITLINSDSIPVRTLLSGQQGLFFIEKLPSDTYFLQLVNSDTSLVPGAGLLPNAQTPFFNLATGEQRYLQMAFFPKPVSNTGEKQENNAFEWRIFPNPPVDRLQILLQENESRSLQLSLLDAQGKKLQQRNLTTLPGLNQLDLEVQQLPAGLYHIVLQSDENKSVRRFIKLNGR